MAWLSQIPLAGLPGYPSFDSSSNPLDNMPQIGESSLVRKHLAYELCMGRIRTTFVEDQERIPSERIEVSTTNTGRG